MNISELSIRNANPKKIITRLDELPLISKKGRFNKIKKDIMAKRMAVGGITQPPGIGIIGRKNKNITTAYRKNDEDETPPLVVWYRIVVVDSGIITCGTDMKS